MTDEKSEAVVNKRGGRSPAYPMLALEEAVARIRKVWDAQRKHAAHIHSVMAALGYNTESGTSRRTIAALNQYGLIDESGNGDERRISVSERAQDILHLPESDSRRVAALKSAAIQPSIYADLWQRYGKSLPSDEAIRPYLVRDKGYNESTVPEVIKNYRSTFEFAKLGDLDEISPESAPVSLASKGQNAQHETDAVKKQPMNTEQTQELPVLVGNGRIAKIPFPMTEENFELMIATLNLWKKKLTEPPVKDTE